VVVLGQRALKATLDPRGDRERLDAQAIPERKGLPVLLVPRGSKATQDLPVLPECVDPLVHVETTEKRG